MLGKPKFKRGDVVYFTVRDERKCGTVFGVDPYGTFEQNEEPSYDLFVVDENCLYKHIRERGVSAEK